LMRVSSQLAPDRRGCASHASLRAALLPPGAFYFVACHAGPRSLRTRHASHVGTNPRERHRDLADVALAAARSRQVRRDAADGRRRPKTVPPKRRRATCISFLLPRTSRGKTRPPLSLRDPRWPRVSSSGAARPSPSGRVLLLSRVTRVRGRCERDTRPTSAPTRASGERHRDLAHVALVAAPQRRGHVRSGAMRPAGATDRKRRRRSADVRRASRSCSRGRRVEKRALP
jgi:hypothetical protein